MLRRLCFQEVPGFQLDGGQAFHHVKQDPSTVDDKIARDRNMCRTK
jgi:hypothetical protein